MDLKRGVDSAHPPPPDWNGPITNYTLRSILEIINPMSMKFLKTNTSVLFRSRGAEYAPSVIILSGV